MPPEDVWLLQRLCAERPDLATRWLAEIDREKLIHLTQALLEARAASLAGGDEVVGEAE